LISIYKTNRPSIYEVKETNTSRREPKESQGDPLVPTKADLEQEPWLRRIRKPRTVAAGTAAAAGPTELLLLPELHRRELQTKVKRRELTKEKD
jgi:hypothetical protein